MSASPKKVRVSTLRRMKAERRRITMVTAYDAITAALAEAAGLDVILVGDSLGMTALGLPTTLPVTLDMMLHHAAAVARGAVTPLLVGDMPFMTYKVSPEQALANAGRMIQEGSMEAVKIEGGKEMAPVVERLVEAGLPVMGHIGLLPQSIHAQGGFRVQGREAGEAERLEAEARALEAAGIFALVLEAMPTGIAERITRAVAIPTIGVGAGPACDGQVLVTTDLLGLTDKRIPKLARPYAHLFDDAVKALRAYAEDVRQGRFPGPENTYGE